MGALQTRVWLASRVRGVVLGLALAGIVGWIVSTPPASAYDRWSTDRTSGNCADCHGDFRAGSYVSKVDNAAWNTSLHDGHRDTMLNGDCTTCHGSGARFPVLLGSSAGGTGFSPIGCLGCHGRLEPAAGGSVTGSGLRQHHVRKGIVECADPDCHGDGDPASFTTAAETVFPPYYFTPDDAHPMKPSHPCNVGGAEGIITPALGLDNDGNLTYDLNDPNCAATPTKKSSWGRIKSIYR